MSISNATTLEARISGSSIILESEIRLVIQSASELFTTSGNYARFKRRAPGGSWTVISGDYNITPSGNRFRIAEDISYTDNTGLVNENTYEYILEMEVYTEAGSIE